MHLECAFEKSDDANPALIVPKLIQLCGLVQPFSSSVGFLYLVGFICVCKFFFGFRVHFFLMKAIVLKPAPSKSVPSSVGFLHSAVLVCASFVLESCRSEEGKLC